MAPMAAPTKTPQQIETSILPPFLERFTLPFYFPGQRNIAAIYV